MCSHCSDKSKSNPEDISRRGFLLASAAGAGLASANAVVPLYGALPERAKKPAVVRCVFLYPPSSTLKEAGYYSWPGSGFDAEGRQKTYEQKLNKIGPALGVQFIMASKPIDTEADAARFIAEVNTNPTDGLLLVLFKKGHWERVKQIFKAVKVPTLITAPLGTLLVDQIIQARDVQGVHLINALDDFGAIEYGLRMVRTLRRMKDSVLIDLAPGKAKEISIPFWGTTVRTVPLERFYEAYGKVQSNDDLKALAGRYKSNAVKIVEPNDSDIFESAKCYFAFKELIAAEQADALMMTCLPGLQVPHKHVPPCMGFMSLRDEGFVAGCQSDLNATLSLMLVQELFDRPGFQQNAAMNTVKNLYFGAHCTCPTKMRGLNAPPEPYILRNHAEAGWGCVPRVLFTPNQEATLTFYAGGEKPQMYVYTGRVVDCPELPPAGGCRTNLEMTINEVADVRDVKGMHQTLFYGNHGRDLRTFCQLIGLEVIPKV